MFARLLFCVFSAMLTSLLVVCFGTGFLGKRQKAHTVVRAAQGNIGTVTKGKFSEFSPACE